MHSDLAIWIFTAAKIDVNALFGIYIENIIKSECIEQ